MQTVVTPAVKSFAAQFKGAKMDLVRAIVDGVAKFEKVKITMREAKEVYAKRTASEIIETHTVGVFEFGKLKSYGCVDSALAIIAALRAKGIEAIFVRDKTHAYALAKVGPGKMVRIDPYPDDILINSVSAETVQRLQGAVDNGIAAVGRDAWDVGLNSLHEFNKYAKAR